MGARDETLETSGALLALKNTYLKTLKNRSESTNFGTIQMSGGHLTMDYDQERTFFKAQCLEYDAEDMLHVMMDAAFEPRSILAANIARAKNQRNHDQATQLMLMDPSANIEQLLIKTAYGE